MQAVKKVSVREKHSTQVLEYNMQGCNKKYLCIYFKKVSSSINFRQYHAIINIFNNLNTTEI